MRRLLSVAVVALLAGCGALHGQVVDKQYQPSWTSWETRAIYRQQCVSVASGSYNSRSKSYSSSTHRSCRDVWAGTHVVPVFHPSCALLTVRRDDGKTSSRCVSENRFYSVEIGQRYDE